MDTLSSAIKIYPGDPEVFFLLASAKHKLSSSAYDQRADEIFADLLSSALDDVANAIKLAPNFADAYILRSELYCAKNWQFEQAIDDLNKALQIAPGNMLALLKLAQLYCQVGQLEDSARVLDLATEFPASCAEIARMRLELNSRLGRSTECLLDLDFLISKMSGTAELYFDRAKVHHDMNNCAAALADIDSACGLSAEWKVLRSEFHLLHYQFDLAEKDLLEISKGDDIYSKRIAQSKLVGLYAGLRRFDKALELVNLMVKDAAPGFLIQCLVARTFICLQLGQSDSALQDCNHALRLIEESYGDSDPVSIIRLRGDTASVLTRRGAVYARMQNLGAAESDFRRAYELALSAHEYEALGKLGESVMESGLWHFALEIFSSIIDAIPASDKAYMGRARTFESIGKIDEAIKDYSASLSLNPARYPQVRRLSSIDLSNLVPASSSLVVSSSHLSPEQFEAFDEAKLFRL